MINKKFGKRWHNLLKLLLNNPRSSISGVLHNLYEISFTGKIPTRPFSSIISERQGEIKLQYLYGDIQGVTITELCLLSLMTYHLSPTKIFEFGTADGRTALNFALNSSDICEIYTIDLPREDRLKFYQTEKALVGEENYPITFKESIGSCFRDHLVSKKITQILGDSTECDFSPYLGKMDLIFIDANHEYEYVQSDTENAFKMLSSRGVIIWHDYPHWEGVCTYIDELYEGGMEVFRVQGTKLACYIPSSYT